MMEQSQNGHAESAAGQDGGPKNITEEIKRNLDRARLEMHATIDELGEHLSRLSSSAATEQWLQSIAGGLFSRGGSPLVSGALGSMKLITAHPLWFSIGAAALTLAMRGSAPSVPGEGGAGEMSGATASGTASQSQPGDLGEVLLLGCAAVALGIVAGRTLASSTAAEAGADGSGPNPRAP